MSGFDLVEKMLKESLNDAQVKIIDLGGGNHLRVEVVSKEFDGKPMIKQHKIVHDILDSEMEFNGGFIHALSIKTSLPK